MGAADFQIGRWAMVKPDPDVDFSGALGFVAQLEVDCFGGEGLILDIPGLGPIKGTYDMFEAVPYRREMH